MTTLWANVAVILVAVGVLVAAKRYRAKLERAGAPLIVALLAVCLAGIGVAVYAYVGPQWGTASGEAGSAPAGAASARGGPGGGGGWRERFRHTFELIGLVRKLPMLDRQEGRRLSRDQAVALAPIVKRLGTEPKLTQEQAKATVEAIQQILTPDQAKAVAAIELPRRRRGGGRRGGPGRGPATQPSRGPGAERAAASRPGGRPPGRAGRGPGRGRREPDRNPFLRERLQPTLAALAELIAARQTGAASTQATEAAGVR